MLIGEVGDNAVMFGVGAFNNKIKSLTILLDIWKYTVVAHIPVVG